MTPLLFTTEMVLVQTAISLQIRCQQISAQHKPHYSVRLGTPQSVLTPMMARIVLNLVAAWLVLELLSLLTEMVHASLLEPNQGDKFVGVAALSQSSCAFYNIMRYVGL